MTNTTTAKETAKTVHFDWVKADGCDPVRFVDVPRRLHCGAWPQRAAITNNTSEVTCKSCHRSLEAIRKSAHWRAVEIPWA